MRRMLPSTLMPSRSGSLAIEARDLTKTFRSGWLRRRGTQALGGVSLQVERGAIFGLLGPNGAGKTTLLSILATLLVPDGGSARVLGLDVVREATALRRRLNMASGRPSFLWSLRVEEIIAFYGRLYGLHGAALTRRVGALVEQYELGDHRKAQYNELSTGLKQRVALAKALVNDPELLFLDEPTTGFDPNARRNAWEIVKNLTGIGKTIFLTTHFMDEAQYLATRAAVIASGQIVAEGTPGTLGGRDHMQTRVRCKVPAGQPSPPDLGGTRSLPDGSFEIRTDNPTKVAHDLTAWALDRGFVFDTLEVTQPSLEDVYIELTGGQAGTG
jgi:ABC-2 type transport system ATP-binding protein